MSKNTAMRGAFLRNTVESNVISSLKSFFPYITPRPTKAIRIKILR
jgi:hypothetical protein